MYVVTGGAGFIGSNVAAAVDERWPGRLVICDHLHDGDKWLNVAKREIAEVVAPGNLFDFLDGHRDDVQAVIHMGAISATTEPDVDLVLENNFRLSLRLWRWCTAQQVPFIYASSAATYGDGSQGFDDDGSIDALARLRPLNPYGWSKHLFDRLVARNLANGYAHPPQWAGLKFFNVYGPNEYHKEGQKSVVAQIYPKARDDAPATLFESHHPDYADGGQLRDFVWVGDCVDVVMWLLENPSVSGLFNCGTGKARSFKDLAEAVFRALDKEPLIEYVPTPEIIRDRYQYFTEADMGRLRAAGYDRPFTELEDGVAKYVQRYLAGNDIYR